MKVALNETINRIETLSKKGETITGFRTGFAGFDAMTAGLQPGNLVIIAGRPSMGKTAFALNMAQSACLRGETVAFFSLEMSTQEILVRMLSAQSGICISRLRSGRIGKDDWVPIAKGMQDFWNAPFYVDDSPVQSVSDVRAKSKLLKVKGAIDLVIVDYLQLIHPAGRFDNRNLEIAHMTRSLKALAKELKIPVIALSQLSRKVDDRMDKRPMLSDLRDSGAVEQDADLVCFIFREEVYKKDKPELDGKAELIVAKQRNGPVGMIPLTFEKEFALFKDPSEIAAHERESSHGFFPSSGGMAA